MSPHVGPTDLFGQNDLHRNRKCELCD